MAEAAPVVVAERHLWSNQGLAQLLLINTGNANAGTGAMGIIAAENCCDAIADLASVNRSEVLPFSTGVIGEPLDADRIRSTILGNRFNTVSISPSCVSGPIEIRKPSLA